MLKSLFTSLSGLKASATAMGTIGNNVANVNTVGFKATRNEFAEILSSSINNNISMGAGVKISSTIPDFQQGSIITTGNLTDLAIDGDGFFIVNNGEGNYYTRAGTFILDKNGNLSTPEGYILQGWTIDENGSITGTLTNINLSDISSSAKKTSYVDLKINLDARTAVHTDTFDPDDTNTYDFSTSFTVYDSVGASHAIDAYYRKVGDNKWEVHYLYTTNSGSTVEAGVQDLDFNEDGSLKDDHSGTPITFDFGGGVETQEITFNYGTGTGETPSGSGLDGATQFSLPFSTSFLGQDGYPAGDLVTINIDEGGTIEGLFSNGQTRKLYKIAVAKFSSPWNLKRLGDNLYAKSGTSGDEIVGLANTGGRGKILSGSLEMSNVDLATEFTNMILVQRAFQANARVITTSDQMLTELVNLKR